MEQTYNQIAKYLDMVREFTTASGYKYSDYTDANGITKQIGVFTLKMVTSEYIEMCSTEKNVGEIISDIIYMFQNIPEFSIIVNKAEVKTPKHLITALQNLAEHCITYANQKNYNLYDAFKVVHDANMKKRFPDGTFHLREQDGKVIKPPGFQDPVFPKEYYAGRKTGVSREFGLKLIVLLAEVAVSINHTATLNDMLQTDIDYNKSTKNLDFGDPNENEMDAIIDIMYYVLNSITKLEQIFAN